MPAYVLIGLGSVTLSLLLDQISKAMVLGYFTEPQMAVPVTSFFEIILTHNYGVSWGLFNTGAQANAYIFSTLAGVISIGLFIWMWQSRSRFMSVALGMIIGGAIGNVIDRLRFGAVVDFLHFYWKGYSFPVFNIADAAITIGVCLIFIDSFIHPKEES